MKFKFIYTFFVLLLFASLFMSSAGGRSDSWANAPGDSGFCGTCHFDAGVGNIVITGAPSNYVSGQTYNMTLTINDLVSIVGGFQIVATNGINNSQVGSFTPGVGQTINNVSRLVQSTPKAFAGGSVSWPISWTAPSSGAPANVRFYFAGNAANGNGFSGAGDMGYFASTSNIPLPVQLSFFDVNPTEKETVQLNWQTQSEENNDYFEIQRSRNDIDFETIGRIFSEGNSTEIVGYEFEDKLPILNQFSYYRLKQVDLDGTFAFSNIQSVKMESEGSFDIFPNPIYGDGKLNISYSNKSNLEKRVHIVNSMGAVVFESILDLQNEEKNVLLDITELPIGIYFVSVFEHENLVGVKKLIVQE